MIISAGFIAYTAFLLLDSTSACDIIVAQDSLWYVNISGRRNLVDNIYKNGLMGILKGYTKNENTELQLQSHYKIGSHYHQIKTLNETFQ